MKNHSVNNHLLQTKLNSATLLGLTAVILWSLSALMMVLTGNVPAFMTLAVSSLLTCFYYVAIHFLWRPVIPAVARLNTGFWVSFVGIFGYFCCYVLSFKLAPALHVNLLNYLWPVFTALLGGLFFRVARLDRVFWFWLMTAFIGCVGLLTFSHTGEFTVSENAHWGYLLALMAALIWALYNNLTRLIQAPRGGLFYVFGLMGLCAGIISIVFESPIIPDSREWFGLVGFSVVNLGYIAWEAALKSRHIKPVLGLAYLIPVFSTAILIVFLGASLTRAFIVFALLILVSSVMINRRNARKPIQQSV